jgi:glutaminase
MTGQDMQAMLSSILDEVRPLIGLGKVADLKKKHKEETAYS